MKEILEIFKQVPIKEIGKYVQISEVMLSSIQKEGVCSLFDFWVKDFDEVVTAGFHKKRAKEIQNVFLNLSMKQIKDGIEDFLFWEKERILPTEYDASRLIEENLQLVLEELLEYIDGCVSRESQIYKKRDKKRVKNLQSILRGFYVEHLSRENVANLVGKSTERAIRQLLFLELLDPLFKGETLNKITVLKRLSINKDLVQKVQEFRKTHMFKGYQLNENCDVGFFEDVLHIDFLTYPPLSYIVPPREKLCYKVVLKGFIDEMTAVMRGKPIEELEEIIDQNQIIQREIYKNHKTYDEGFIYQLLYDDQIIQDTESGKLIRPEYIRNFGTDELGSIHQERALARIIADQSNEIRKEDIIRIYNQRYGQDLSVKHNLEPTIKYGCKAIGRTHWIYNQDAIPLKDWISNYTANIGRPFTFDEVKQAISEDAIAYNSDATIRTYITKYCAVHCRNSDKFCHRDIVPQQDDYKQWRERIRSGVFNWLVNEIHLLFQQRNVDKLVRNDFNKNLSTVMPQKLYEFFVVSNPTSIDRYCIMCSIAKNFEALLDSIARRIYRITVDRENPANGIYQKSKRYNFEDITDILDNTTKIQDLTQGSYQYALKNLNYVRNADSHGNWYLDKYATDNNTEDERNIKKILNFAALYIFTYAKYAMSNVY